MWDTHKKPTRNANVCDPSTLNYYHFNIVLRCSFGVWQTHFLLHPVTSLESLGLNVFRLVGFKQFQIVLSFQTFEF